MTLNISVPILALSGEMGSQEYCSMLCGRWRWQASDLRAEWACPWCSGARLRRCWHAASWRKKLCPA